MFFVDLETDEEEPKVKEPKLIPKPKTRDEAPVFTALLKDRSIETGSAARFDARAIGNPTPKVTWYKDDKEITPTAFPHMKVLDEGDLHSLLITEGTSKDSGVFKCVAKNSAGQDSTIGKLYVEGKKAHLKKHRFICEKNCIWDHCDLYDYVCTNQITCLVFKVPGSGQLMEILNL